MVDMASKHVEGHEAFPKLVYPGWDGEGLAPPAETAVTVKNEDEEKWVMEGNKLDDFGKPPKEEKKPAGWKAP